MHWVHFKVRDGAFPFVCVFTCTTRRTYSATGLLHSVMSTHIQLCELWALGWRHCLVSGCFVLSWPGPGGGIIEHELGADRKCSVRPAEHSERSRNLPEYRQMLCVCHTARSVYPNAVVTFDLIGRWDGESSRCPSQQILKLTHKNKSFVCSWQLIRNLGAQSAAESKWQFFDHLPPPANQKPAGMCAAHLELFSIFTHTDTNTLQLTVQS